jgi:hypothetical protein
MCPNRNPNRGLPRTSQSSRRQAEEFPVEEYQDEDEQQAETSWQRNLLLRAHKAVGDAKLNADWLLDEPPAPGVIVAVREAAAAWTKLADQLQSLADAATTNDVPPLADDAATDQAPALA